MSEAAIKVQGVNKTFKLPHQKQNSIKGLFVNMFRKNRTFERQQVLHSVSFDVKKGDFFGIVGRNGSGKSTLLKLLAGIYEPDKGSVIVNGRLTPFIELGVGFNPELTGRDNVYLNGALLGFSRNEMDQMYDEIVAFAEVERFMDQKLKNYSSGMQVRLAFSIAIRATSDILLVDEVLAVGDTAFQKKCYEVFTRLKSEGRTIVFVTHDMGAVERFCNRVVVIDKGKLLGEFSPSDATAEYDRLNVSDDQKSPLDTSRWGTGEVRVSSLKFKSGPKEKAATFMMGQPFEMAINLSNPNKKEVVVGIGIEDAFGVNISGPNSLGLRIKDPKQVCYRIEKLPLLPGDYKVTVAVFDQDLVQEYDHLEKAYTFRVVADQHALFGKVNFFGAWSIK